MILQYINTQLALLGYPAVTSEESLCEEGVDSIDLAQLLITIEDEYHLTFDNEWRQFNELPISELIKFIQENEAKE